jgi:hemerythrin superfamily protein
MLGMFEGSKEKAMSAIELLKSDHDEVEKMFEEYEDGKEDADAQSKEELVEAICKALEVHAQLEEELFYPAFREVEDMEDLLDEAAVEHETVKMLVAQLEASTPDDMLYDARVTVLSEYVKHHVREEEGEIFPKARSSTVDLEDLGRVMMSRKEELQQGGAVPAIEEVLSERRSRGRGQAGSKRGVSNSPAASRKTSSRGATSRKSSSKGATSKRTSARGR